MIVLSKDTNPQVRIFFSCNLTHKIFDLNENTACWKARNVKNDYLDLTVPIYDLDCAFKNENEFYVSTAYHKVTISLIIHNLQDKIRLYDVRTKNCKPVIDYEYPHSKHPLNNILLSQCKNYAYVSDQSGSIAILDTRKGNKYCS